MSEASALVRLHTHCPDCQLELAILREGLPDPATKLIDVTCECGWTGSVPMFVPLDALWAPADVEPVEAEDDDDSDKPRRSTKKRR